MQRLQCRSRCWLCVLKESVSVCETIDDHDGFVMRMADGGGFDDEVRLRWDADMMCSAS
jgi:hypothetical protein